MESLPTELMVKIVSRLNLHDQAKCRLVSRSFKNAVESNLKSITHIALEEVDVKSDHYFIYIKFLDASFFQINESKKYICFSSKLASFLAMKCPNIQVLYSKSLRMRLKDLQKLGKSLKFFSCYKFFVPEKSSHTIQQLNSFEQLEAFHCTKFNHKIDEISNFKNKLLLKSNFITHIENPSNELLSQFTNSSVSKNIRSVEYNGKSDESHSLHETIASNLSCFSIKHREYNPPNIEGPLSNLVSLSLEGGYFLKGYCDNLFDSYKLVNINCIVSFQRSFYPDFFISLNLYHHLKYIKFAQIYTPSSQLSFLEVSLPPEIEIFDVFIESVTFEIINASSATLRELTINNLGTYEWQFPRLELLHLKFTRIHPELKEEHVKELSLSLSKCTRMKILTISSNTLQSNFMFQSILDSMKVMSELETVLFKRYPSYNRSFLAIPNRRENSSAIKIDQSKLSSVVKFELEFPVNVQFYTLKSCERIDNHYDDDDVKFVLNGCINYYFKYGKLVEFI